MKAVILAGGKGTRLAPYTKILPKPLMPIGDMPILEILLRQMQRSGVDEAILTVGHLAELLRAFFNDGSQLGLKLSYSYEDQPLGTAGPLAMLDGLDETFLVSNGDVLTTLDLRDRRSKNTVLVLSNSTTCEPTVPASTRPSEARSPGSRIRVERPRLASNLTRCRRSRYHSQRPRTRYCGVRSIPGNRDRGYHRFLYSL